ncbi:MAG: exodeoxyribonuclease VII large subunit [Verrucomicrobiota bacterium]|nr:exodeoxyribonuclease VII large subunit [Verrucomicrobiota bacterium]
MSREQQSLWDFSGSPDVGKTRRVYGVSELNREVKGLLEKRLGTVWVVGQVTGLRQQASGHIYFSIKDEGGQLSCALFRGVDAEKHSLLEDGVQLVLQAKVTVFEPRGQYQLIVRKLELQGQGELQVRFEKLKHKLKSEGLFESERKRPLPSFPARLGLVTSPTGAAIRDVLHVVQRRNPSLQIVLGPCRVQGDGAAVEMAKAIQQLNLWSAGQVDGKALDLILLTRGGGSLEDLWAFNEEVLARAVHQSELPVVSAVGHEIDFLITDFVGDVRASTPSVAAELITQDVFASRGSLGDAAIQLSRLVKRRVSLDKRNLLALSHRLGRAHPRRALDDSYQRLGNQYDDLNRLTREGVAIRRASLSLARQRLASLRPAALLLQRREQLTWLQHRLDDVQRHKLEEHCARFRGVLSRLELLSPKAVLSRGYSITCDAKTGAVLRDARKAKSGQVLRTQLHNGDISSTVNPSDTFC